MKYQIYLNKKTSEFINLMAEAGGIKPATIIKQLIESFVILSEPVKGSVLAELTPKDHTTYLEAIHNGAVKRK